jgi:hypothetical protein
MSDEEMTLMEQRWNKMSDERAQTNQDRNWEEAMKSMFDLQMARVLPMHLELAKKEFTRRIDKDFIKGYTKLTQRTSRSL